MRVPVGHVSDAEEFAETRYLPEFVLKALEATPKVNEDF